MKKRSRGKERNKKSMEQMLSGVAEDATSTISETISGFLPEPGGIADKFLTFGVELLPMLGLDKPINNAATEWVMNTTAPHLADGEGLSNRHVLGLKHSTHLANTPESFGSKLDERLVKSIKTRPGLWFIGTFNATADPDEIIYSWRNTPCISQAVNETSTGDKFVWFLPCAWIAQAFKYWHGTMKYLLHVACSEMITAKIRVGIVPRFADIPAIGSTIQQGAGDFNSRTYDISGDTWIKFSVPYLNDLVMSDCQSPYFKSEVGCACGIFISVVNPAVAMNSASATTLGFSLWAAAHEDMRFEQLSDRPMDAVPNMNASTPGASTLIAQSGGVKKSIDEIFLEDFESLVPANTWDILDVTGPETYDDLYTCAHRMVSLNRYTIDQAGAETFILPTREILQTSACSSMFAYMLRYFMYWRGSYDMNLYPTTPAGDVDGYLYAALVEPSSTSAFYPIRNSTDYYGQGGVAMESLVIRKGIHVNLPYYSKYTFLETQPFQTPTAGTTALNIWLDTVDAEAVRSFRLFIAPGDDFSMGWGAGTPLVSFHLTT